VKNILIVDRSPDLIELMVTIFQKEDIKAAACSNINNLFDSLRQFMPRLIIMDVAGNGDTEKKMCLELKRENDTRNIPIIITSTYGRHVKDYEQFGASDAIEKPFSIDDLIAKVKTYMAGVLL